MAANDTSTDNMKLLLGSRIRRLRKEHKLNISDLANLTELTSSTISQMERGIISPSIATLKKICDAMNIPLSFLFESVENNIPDTFFGNSPDKAVTASQNITEAPALNPEAYLNALPPVDLRGASPVVHKENRKLLSPGEGIRFHLLTPNLSGPIELIYNEYDPGATTGPAFYSHPGSECGLILSGELVIQIKEDVYTLKEGDSITFNSSDPHLKKNISDKMCTCIWANVPPWF